MGYLERRGRSPVPCLAAALLAAALATFAARAGTAPCTFASLAEAKAMAIRAAAFLDKVGPKMAFAAFMDPAGGFIDRDLYVFVFDLDGTIWASGGFPETVGSNALGARDGNGRFFIREAIRIALEKGEGWIAYDWLNPCTGRLSPKVSFVKRVGPLIVGVGAYGTVSA